MKARMRAHRRSRGLASVVAVAAVAVVTIGAAARPKLSLGGRLDRPSGGGEILGVGESVFIELALLGGVFLIALRVAMRRRKAAMTDDAAGARLPWWARVTVQLVLLAVLVYVLARLRSSALARQPHVTIPPSAGPIRPSPGQDATGAGSSLSLTIALAAAAVLFVLLAGALAWRRWRPRGEVELAPEATDGNEVVQDAARGAARAMRDITDPRAAIIACYRSMQAALSRAGVPDKPSDTPSQLLARTTAAQFAPGAAETLTELYLEAKFSKHPMGADQRQRAVDALDALAGHARRHGRAGLADAGR